MDPNSKQYSWFGLGFLLWYQLTIDFSIIWNAKGFYLDKELL